MVLVVSTCIALLIWQNNAGTEDTQTLPMNKPEKENETEHASQLDDSGEEAIITFLDKLSGNELRMFIESHSEERRTFIIEFDIEEPKVEFEKDISKGGAIRPKRIVVDEQKRKKQLNLLEEQIQGLVSGEPLMVPSANVAILEMSSTELMEVIKMEEVGKVYENTDLSK